MTGFRRPKMAREYSGEDARPRGGPQRVSAPDGIAQIDIDVRDERSLAVDQWQGFWKDALRRRMLAAADLLAVIAAAVVTGTLADESAALWIAASAPLWLVVAKLRGLYDRDHVRIRHLTLDESSGLFHWVVLCAGGISIAIVGLTDADLTVGSAMLMAATSLCAAFAFRVAARAVWRRAVPPERGVILGSGRIADAFARRLALESGHHLELTGRLPLTDPDWERQLQSEDVERVIVAAHDLNEETLARVVSHCRSTGVKLSVAPPMRAMLGTAVELSHLAELPLIEFRTWDPSRSTMLLKRTMDVVGAALALVALTPWLVVIGIAVRIDSRGPALFRQTRAGRDGRPFQMLKFRTMVDGAETRVAEVIAMDDLAEPAFKVRGDPRVTRVGRLLRRTSIDELPQLVNVLRGDMSLVGPRPEEVWLVERYGEADRFRLEMRPGITGPMQVHGRGELTFQERMSVEREYVENYSLRKDVKILFQTFAAVVNGRGAF
jgi:exopolysaccharide biosynthesis polyprenyl glycosylphosphotransferase